MPVETRAQRLHGQPLSESTWVNNSNNGHPPPALDHPDDPPVYTINLSLPPCERYVQIAADFKHLLSSAAGMFDDIVRNFYVHLPMWLARGAARLFLRRVHSTEETEELRGISQVAGVDMHLLVALNTFLDLMMGCTSGGVRTQERRGYSPLMLHFRTLDWGMDPLRRLVVQLEFVERPGAKVIARSISYVGFVGVLTGVRDNLSMSLNFRPNHDASSKLSHWKFYKYQLKVVLGRQPSLASILRNLLFSSTIPTLETISSEISQTPSTAAYLIFCDGQKTLILEKDLNTSKIRERCDFLVTTNHDLIHENQDASNGAAQRSSRMVGPQGAEDFLAESISRKLCIRDDWRQAVKNGAGIDIGEHEPIDDEEDDFGVSVKRAHVIDWVQAWPITNECTHYAVVMSPRKGEILWIKRFLYPVEESKYSLPSDSA